MDVFLFFLKGHIGGVKATLATVYAPNLHQDTLSKTLTKLAEFTEGNYMFFSNPHQLYSRLDLFLVPHHLLASGHKVVIGNITWSDHGDAPYLPVWLGIVP